MDPSELLNPADEPAPDPDALRAIVDRAGRRRWRSVVAGVAAAVIAGGGIGWAVADHGSKGQTVASTSSPAASGSGANPALAPLSGSIDSAAGQGSMVIGLTHEFTRTVGGFTVRGYLGEVPLPSPATCGATDVQTKTFQAEVSDAAAVDTTTGYASSAPSATGFGDVSVDVFGIGEGAPAAVALANVGSQVTEVKVTFKGGVTDEMAPVGGWVALAGTLPSGTSQADNPYGTIEALGAGGKVLKSESLNDGMSLGWYGYAPLTGNPTSGGAASSSACGCAVAPGRLPSGSGSGSGISGSAGSSASSGSATATGNVPNNQFCGCAVSGSSSSPTTSESGQCTIHAGGGSGTGSGGGIVTSPPATAPGVSVVPLGPVPTTSIYEPLTPSSTSTTVAPKS